MFLDGLLPVLMQNFQASIRKFLPQWIVERVTAFETSDREYLKSVLKIDWNFQQKRGRLNVSIWFQWFIETWINSMMTLWNGVIYGEKVLANLLFFGVISLVLPISKKNIIYESHSRHRGLRYIAVVYFEKKKIHLRPQLSNSMSSCSIRDGRWSWLNIYLNWIRSATLSEHSIYLWCPFWHPTESRLTILCGQNYKNQSTMMSQKLFLSVLLKIAIRRKLLCWILFDW